MSLAKAVRAINENKRFLITSHVNLEADALGSELALADLLRRKGKSVIVLNQDKVPEEYNFLPGIQNVKNKLGNFVFDVVVALDCSDETRCGDVRRLFTKDILTVNIDHHISNNNFADINWVEPCVSSVCEMIYGLYKKMRTPLVRESAVALYSGMVTDTGSFRYPNTSWATHRAASDLLRFGIQPYEIYKNIYQSVSFEEMKLLFRVLPSLKKDCNGKVVWYAMPRNVIRKNRPDFDLTEHALNFARLIKGIEVAVVFKENLGARNQIKVNLRSQGRVDVNKIALVFGGGGHKTAGACTINGTLARVSRMVLKKIGEFV